MSICSSFPSFSGLSSSSRKNHEQQSITIDSLKTIYDETVKKTTSVFLDTEFLDSVNIKCEPLLFNDDGSYATPPPPPSSSHQPCFFFSFFQPFPLNRLLDDHPINMHHSRTRRNLESSKGSIEADENHSSDLDGATFLSSFTYWQFAALPRIGTPHDNNGSGLVSLTKWRKG